MKLSIIVPGIRPQNWLALYQSIPNATTLNDYELIIISPYDLPPELQSAENVRLIKDWGHPTRCHQLGLLQSQGEYVIWGADDGTVIPGMAIDKAFVARPQCHKGIVSLRYGEGKKRKKRSGIDNLKWWTIQHHSPLRNLKYIPNHYMIIMIALIKRDYLMEMGGWDCRFEQPGMACVDLAVRLQNDGAQSVLGEKVWHFSHLINEEHKPIEEAHNLNDMPLVAEIYTQETNKDRARIDFDNWKDVPEVWARRFPGGKV